MHKVGDIVKIQVDSNNDFNNKYALIIDVESSNHIKVRVLNYPSHSKDPMAYNTGSSDIFIPFMKKVV